MTIKFVHKSKKISLEESRNAATNLYNDSPKFRKMIDEMDATGVPVTIVIGDNVKDGLGQDGSTVFPHFQKPSEGEKEAQVQQHKNGVPDANGITPTFDGKKMDRARVIIDTKELITNYRYPIAKDGSQKATDDDHDGFADHTENFSFEGVLAHELYHIKDGMDGRGEGSVWNETEEETDERKRTREIRAAKFESAVVKEVLPEGDPRGEMRVYHHEGISTKTDYGREGRSHRSEFPATEKDPHILNPSKPEKTNEKPPWEWYTVKPKTAPVHDAKTIEDEKTSKFMGVQEEDDLEASDSKFSAALILQGEELQAVDVIDPTEPATLPPSQDGFTV